MLSLKNIISNKVYKEPISEINTKRKCVIATINAHSFCISKNDLQFREAISNCDVLLPDGVSIVYAAKILNHLSLNKIAGADLHLHLLENANLEGKKVFYLGSSSVVLNQIESRIKIEYPKIRVQSYSPQFKPVFNNEDTKSMLSAVNAFKPDILFVGMTAPKQEKWVEMHKAQINASVIASIGAVFDFYAGNIERAPVWMIDNGLEWLNRLIKEPRRMWKRYLINNTKFISYVIKEKYL